MALDFSPLQNINPGEAFLQGRQEAQRNALAKTQLEQSQLQLQLTRDQLDQARRDRAALDAMAKSFAENGHTGSLDENFDKMIASGIPQYVQIGISGKQKLVEQRRFEQIMGGAAPGAAPAMPTGAPVMTPAAPAGSPVGAALRADLGGAAPTNALAPTPAAPAPVANALAGPVSQINSMRSKRDQLISLGTPQAIKAAEVLDREIVALQRQHVVGGALVGPGGEVIYREPEKPQATPPDIATMQALGYPLTTAGYAQFREAQRQERLLSPKEEAQRIRIARESRPLPQPRPEAAPRTKEVTMSDGTIGIMNMDTGEVTPASLRGAPVKGKPSAFAEKTAAQRKQLGLDLDRAIAELTDAAKDGGLIDQSTGSGAGRLVDIGAGFVGQATPGAIAAGKLAPIADLALKMVPRFEGPQSNMDTKSYKEAAGQLADSTLPNKIRKEAAKTVVRLMRERKGQFASPEMVSAGAAQDTGVDTSNPLLK